MSLHSSEAIIRGAAAGILAATARNRALDEYLDTLSPHVRRSVSHLLFNYFRYRRFIEREVAVHLVRAPRPQVGALLGAATAQLYFQQAIAPESAVNVARHMIAAIAGVPMLSMKLVELSACHMRVVRHFLDFYRAHRPTLNLGRWHIAYQLDSPAYLRADGESESIVFLLDETRLAEAVQPCRGRELFVLNLAASQLPWQGCEAWEAEGKSAAPGTIPPGGIGHLTV